MSVSVDDDDDDGGDNDDGDQTSKISAQSVSTRKERRSE